MHKQGKTGLTFQTGFGILTKLSDMRQRFENTNSRKTLEKGVDKPKNVWYSIKCSAGKWRVPCKLNNVTKRKHQTETVLRNCNQKLQSPG